MRETESDSIHQNRRRRTPRPPSPRAVVVTAVSGLLDLAGTGL
jgi:hypothetical protein